MRDRGAGFICDPGCKSLQLSEIYARRLSEEVLPRAGIKIVPPCEHMSLARVLERGCERIETVLIDGRHRTESPQNEADTGLRDALPGGASA